MSNKSNVSVRITDREYQDFQRQMMETYGVHPSRASRAAEWMMLALVAVVVLLSLAILAMMAAMQ